MKAIRIMISALLLSTLSIVSSHSTVTLAKQIDRNTPSYERPVVEESSFENVNGHMKPLREEKNEKQQLALSAAVASSLLLLILLVLVYIRAKKRRVPKGARKR